MKTFALLVAITACTTEPLTVTLHDSDPDTALASRVTLDGEPLRIVERGVDEAGATLVIELEPEQCSGTAVAHGERTRRFPLADACATGEAAALEVSEKGQTTGTAGCQCHYVFGTYYLVCGYPLAPYIAGRC